MVKYPLEFSLRNATNEVEIHTGMLLSPESISFEGFSQSIRVDYDIETVVVEDSKWVHFSKKFLWFMVFLLCMVSYIRFKEFAQEEIDRFFDPNYDPLKDKKFTCAIKEVREKANVYLKYRETVRRGEYTYKHIRSARKLKHVINEKGEEELECPEVLDIKPVDLTGIIPECRY
eukprot:CAMPEP_0170482234 /NCGR_PEP_ID=MMETSP0208-20121228/2343_1 /TAXON_ID=197538 /ORGANISM="Strombidium inclinatum, Strain S3" /LENGTH=173 /DNA_ID=CAMNT_0010755049 /DNA_START=273 /DNA_END=794 /DNA_ORIENTATION=+